MPWLRYIGDMTKPLSRVRLQKAFGRTVRRLRLKAGMAQEALALKAGIDRGYMGGIERGEHNPTLETTFRLLRALHISYSEFAREFEHTLGGANRNTI